MCLDLAFGAWAGLLHLWVWDDFVASIGILIVFLAQPKSAPELVTEAVLKNVEPGLACFLS